MFPPPEPEQPQKPLPKPVPPRQTAAPHPPVSARPQQSPPAQRPVQKPVQQAPVISSAPVSPQRAAARPVATKEIFIPDAPPPRRRIWLRLILVVLCMMAIYLGSTTLGRPENSEKVMNPVLKLFGVKDLDGARMVLRKVCHVAEYCVLAWILAYFILGWGRPGLRRWWFALALLGVLLFAITDEWHQSFVPERVASATDVMLDTVSGAVALSLVAGFRLIFRSATD